MSVQRGNYKKKAQKYKNSSAFKNNLHDNSPKTKALNSMVISEVCKRCMDVIQWKITYKKYKPLAQAKRCTKCLQRTVKKAYHVICSKCAKDSGTCAKCGEKREIIHNYTRTTSEAAAHQSKLEAELRFMSERERRAYYRNQSKGGRDDKEETESSDESDEDLKDDGHRHGDASDERVVGEEEPEDEDVENALNADVQNLAISKQSENREYDLSSSDVIR